MSIRIIEIQNYAILIGHFTVVCPVPRSLNRSEAGSDSFVTNLLVHRLLSMRIP